MRISDWSSDVCSSVLMVGARENAQVAHLLAAERAARDHALDGLFEHALGEAALEDLRGAGFLDAAGIAGMLVIALVGHLLAGELHLFGIDDDDIVAAIDMRGKARLVRSEEPTSELQSIMRTS